MGVSSHGSVDEAISGGRKHSKALSEGKIANDIEREIRDYCIFSQVMNSSVHALPQSDRIFGVDHSRLGPIGSFPSSSSASCFVRVLTCWMRNGSDDRSAVSPNP